ncbi:hypothetical protein CONLIGDRAFT_715425 [Coniochaeta ligniaria NRRL 30616]|uniref:Uncharacterized protein n=1 Tax=Coniochaeta ligniaria NRRL 30616 TaxID=1408157 RepID=A0A1J7JMQ2_9PEZI|nr:hypothetical protein CONLIGDRAFT_715425 [Coniochaeta ligniaria NRRL 30616]
MSNCTIAANQGMYGFGIRLSFYIQWVTIIAADYVFTPTRDFHIVLAVALLVGALWTAAAAAGMSLRGGDRKKRKARRKWRRAMRKSCLKDNASIIHFIRTMLHLVVVAVMVTGVELVIRWNHIIDAYSLTTSAQLFPLLLSICLALWVIWHRLKQSEDDGDADTCTTCSLDNGHRRRGNGWPAPGHVPRDWIVDNV